MCSRAAFFPVYFTFCDFFPVVFVSSERVLGVSNKGVVGGGKMVQLETSKPGYYKPTLSCNFFVKFFRATSHGCTPFDLIDHEYTCDQRMVHSCP